MALTLRALPLHLPQQLQHGTPSDPDLSSQPHQKLSQQLTQAGNSQLLAGVNLPPLNRHGHCQWCRQTTTS